MGTATMRKSLVSRLLLAAFILTLFVIWKSNLVHHHHIEVTHHYVMQENNNRKLALQYYDSTEQADSRLTRFPSVQERIQLYMSHWYLPACHDAKKVQYYYKQQNQAALVPSLVLREAAQQQQRRVLQIQANMDIQMDRVFYVNPMKINTCTTEQQHSTNDNNKRHCIDDQHPLRPLLLPLMDEQNNNNKSSSIPLLFQFGNSGVARIDNELNVRLPLFQKFRVSMSVDQVQQVVHNNKDDCWNHIANDNETQPILWKLNTERHDKGLTNVFLLDLDWHAKKNQTVFRGALTGRDVTTATTAADKENNNSTTQQNDDVSRCLAMDRCRVVYKHANSTLVDAKLTSTENLVSSTIDGVSLVSPKKMPLSELLQYKMILILEGHSVTVALKWALLSKSVVLMPPPRYTSWAMEERLEAWVHYVPIENLDDDIEVKVRWVLDHNDEAQRIAQRGSLWIKDLVFHPDATKEDEVIHQEIVHRYQQHFVQSPYLDDRFDSGRAHVEYNVDEESPFSWAANCC